MDDWLKFALAALLVSLAVGTYISHFGRRAKRALPVIEGIPKRHATVESRLPPPEAMARIRTVNAAGKAKVSVAADEPARGLVVLSDELTLKSFANFYPCFVSPKGGGSEIVVGILPPPPQAGPMVAKRLQRMTDAVRAAVAEGKGAAQ
jgi:hypothetical protein